MNANAGIAAPSRSTRPMVRARIARALRDLVALRGWQLLVNRLVPDHSASFTIRNGDTVFAGDIGSFIDRQVYLFGGYESAQIRCLTSLTTPPTDEVSRSTTCGRPLTSQRP